MRCLISSMVLVLVLAVGLPRTAGAQALALHQAVSALTTPASTTPAKLQNTIIPGSPLAAITGAGTPTDPNNEDEPSPFGTNALGLSVSELIRLDAAGTIEEFLAALKKSTTLTPVWQWLQTFPGDPARQVEARQIAEGLVLTVLPAIVLDVLLGLALTRPRAALARRAARLPSTEAEPENIGIAAAEAGETEERPGRRDSVLAWLRRLLLAGLHLALSLAPVLGFVLAAGALLGLSFVTTRDARLSVTGVANAYLFGRITLEVLRFLIAPRLPPLRLVPMPDFRAIWLNRWVRILLVTGGLGFCVVSIGEVLDLPRPGAMAIGRIFALAVHIELAIMIWKSRKVVSGWIRGNPAPESLMAGPRRRFAMVWHYFALFYVLALWVAYAGGVHNAFGVLLRVVLFFIAAIVLGRLGWTGSERALERIFPDPKGRRLRYPTFVSRVRAYNPLVRTLIRIGIAIAVVAIILLGWGVNILAWLLRDPIIRVLIPAFASIIITVTIALVIWEIANGFLEGRINRLTATGKTRQALRLRTLSPILKATFGTAIGLLAGLICLSKIGVNAAPLLAGAGVLGIAIGFGSQKLVQDIITGLFLLLEDTMQVGDVVTLAGMSGTVERLSIRTIRLRGGDGSVNIIPFSAVTTVTNQTRDFGYAQIAIGVGYNEDIDHVCAVLTDIARSMRAEATWGSMIRDDLQIEGLDQFGSTALVVTAKIRTGPGQHWSVRREFSRRLLKKFAEEKIDIPYTAGSSTVTLDAVGVSAIVERIRPEDEQGSTSFSEEKEAKRLL